MSPLLRVSSRQVWGARLTHRSRHWHDTQTRADVRKSHRAVFHVNVVPHSQEVSTARQAECAGAVVCSAGVVSFSCPPVYPSILTKRHARSTLPSMSLTPSIARREIADVTSELRRVPRWSCVFLTRRFFAQFFVGCVSPPPLCLGGMRTGGVPPNFSSIVSFH